MTRRELPIAGAIGLALVATLPAYDRAFSAPSWRGPALLAGLLALTIAVVVRRLRLPWAVSLIVSAVGLGMTSYVLHLPAGPLAPGIEQLGAFVELLQQGTEELRETPAPAPPLPGLVAVVTTAFWVVAHIAHEIAVRWRRVGLALVPLATLWAAPLAVPLPLDRTWTTAIAFLAVAGLLLFLGAADEVAGSSGGATARTGSAALTVGGVALIAAIVAPGLLPGYQAEAWIDLGGGGDPRGYQPIVDVADRLKLPTDRDVLRVRAPQRTYLRLAGLDSFDGFTWRLGPVGDGSYRPDPSALYPAREVLPPEAPAAETDPIAVDIEVLELENIYVPVPYQPVQILGPERDQMVWSTEGGFVATWDTVDGELAGQPRVGVREGVSYRVQAARPAPTLEQLREVEIDAATRERWTQLPRDYPELAAQAEEVYQAAGATADVDRALALQAWFAAEGGFEYDLDVPALRGDGALERFVLEDRVGYCEYFATAMAVMLRATGIPARVAVGFLPGRVTAEPDPTAGRDLTEYTVSTRDAHAWVEVLFPGYGWQYFEPTPRDDRTQMVPSEEDLTPALNLREERLAEIEEGRDEVDRPMGDNPVPQVPEIQLPEERDATATPPPRPGDTRRWPLALFATGLVLVGLLTWSRRRPGLGGATPARRILQAQRRLFAVAALYGQGRRRSETATDVVARWQQEGRVDERAERFAMLAQAAAFGGQVDADHAAEAEQLVQQLERSLRESVDRRTRVLAPVRVPATAAWRRARRTATSVRDRVRL